MNYKELLLKANEEVKKVVDYINEHEDMFDMMDLKLHDVNFYIYDAMGNDFPLTYAEENGKNDIIFSRFCECEYDSFIEWCVEKCINFSRLRHDVGRTSKFYLHGWHDKDIDYMIYNILNELDYYSDYYIVLENGVITSTDIDVNEKETINSLEYISDNFYNDFMKKISDMIKVYDYIKDFKDNQVEYFKDFCEEEEDRLSYENEKKNQKEIECKNTSLFLKNKYSISDYDWNLLKQNINNY